jgi:ribosomal protein L12E/L44/L45/RPP1/RPP2
MSNEKNVKPARRGFLRALGVSTAAAAAATAAPAAAQTQAKESRTERDKARYQGNSAHVQAFYRTNRY